MPWHWVTSARGISVLDFPVFMAMYSLCEGPVFLPRCHPSQASQSSGKYHLLRKVVNFTHEFPRFNTGTLAKKLGDGGSDEGCNKQLRAPWISQLKKHSPCVFHKQIVTSRSVAHVFVLRPSGPHLPLYPAHRRSFVTHVQLLTLPFYPKLKIVLPFFTFLDKWCSFFPQYEVFSTHIYL